ncbi:hypothetical protein [Vibrio crassostreae]|uniref:hypothetical protein n=1 Tax=Vibrio crassostreae TaxID=246167 RepID=UPI001B3012E5
MSREAHVPFCEGLQGKFLRSTFLVFREDELKVKDPDGAAHLAAFNRAALNTIKQDESDKDSLAAKRRKSGWSAEYRSKIIFG